MSLFPKRPVRGTTIISYALLLGLVGVVALATITAVGSQVDELFVETGDTLSAVAAVPDPTPVPPVTNTGSFAFDNSSSPTVTTLTESDIVLVSGFENAAVSVGGDGSPQFRICDDATCSTSPAWGTSGTISDGQYLQVRATSPASNFDTNTVSVTIGSVSDDWEVTSGGSGEVLDMAGVWHPVVFAPCRMDSNTCTEAEAKAACAGVGGRVVTHAGNTSSEVFSLGATASCQHSVAYFRGGDVNLAGSGACLQGLSNVDWNPTACCSSGWWHGGIFEFPTFTGDDPWGYIHPSNSGYDSTITGALSLGTTVQSWGCIQDTDTPSTPTAAGVNCVGQYYVACTSP